MANPTLMTAAQGIEALQADIHARWKARLRPELNTPTAGDIIEFMGHVNEAFAAALASLQAEASHPSLPSLDHLVQVTEDETWAGAVTYVRDVAKSLRSTVRAEALEECADGMERAAKKARASLQAEPPPPVPALAMPAIEDGDTVDYADIGTVEYAHRLGDLKIRHGHMVKRQHVTRVRRNGVVLWTRPTGAQS